MVIVLEELFCLGRYGISGFLSFIAEQRNWEGLIIQNGAFQPPVLSFTKRIDMRIDIVTALQLGAKLT